MKRLSKTQLAEKNRITKTLKQLGDELSQTITRANEAIRESGEEVEQGFDKYNAVLEEARGLRDEVVSDIEMTWDEKSDAWKESEAGERYGDWLSAWRDTDLDELSCHEVPEIDEPDNVDHGTELDQLPEKVEG